MMNVDIDENGVLVLSMSGSVNQLFHEMSMFYGIFFKRIAESTNLTPQEVFEKYREFLNTQEKTK